MNSVRCVSGMGHARPRAKDGYHTAIQECVLPSEVPQHPGEEPFQEESFPAHFEHEVEIWLRALWQSLPTAFGSESLLV